MDDQIDVDYCSIAYLDMHNAFRSGSIYINYLLGE